jgi:hypothetical protein
VSRRPLHQKPNNSNRFTKFKNGGAAPKKNYDTWLTRADFTTGDRRCRSANRVALSLSV